MARRITKCFMGIQDNGKDAYRRDTVSTSIQKLPAEVRLISYRAGNHDESRNDEVMRLQLDFMDEVKEMSKQRLAQYRDLMAKRYNSKVRCRDFQDGDLVLRKVMGATKDTSQGKLGPN